MTDTPNRADPDDEPQDPLVGETLLGKLKVVRCIAGGGMGAIYEVEHLITGHRRALKLVRSKYVDEEVARERLLREAGVAGQLDTPYVTETYDAGLLEDGSAYVLMELLDGVQFLDLVQARPRPARGRFLGLLCQVCEGVGAAHEAGIVHRDLKPENVYVIHNTDGREQVKVLDFGIAMFTRGRAADAPQRLTEDGTVMGTPFYMSPEQAGGEDIDHRTDIYSIGVMAYEALTGALPFSAPSIGAVFAKIMRGKYVPLRDVLPEIEPELEAIVARAMAREPEDRFSTVEALRQALVPFAASELAARGRTISDSPMKRTTPPRVRRAKQETEAAQSAQVPVLGSEPPTEPKAERPKVTPLPAPDRDLISSRPQQHTWIMGRSRLPWLVAGSASLVLVAGAAFLTSGQSGDPGPPAAASPGPRGHAGAFADPDRAGGQEGATAVMAADAGVAADAGAIGPAVEANAGATEAVPPVRTSKTKGTRAHGGDRDMPTEVSGETAAQKAGLDKNPY